MPQTRAERNIAWCEEHLVIPEGKFVGQPLVMADFMREDFVAIYDNPAGTRRAILTRGRKNAKTTQSAMIVLLHLCGPEARQSSNLFSAAQSRDQAAILFSLAAKMARMSPTLAPFVGVRDTAKQIYCGELKTLYRALSADATTAYGLSPVLIVHDELGQVKGPRSSLYDALETATAAQEEPLSIVISTQAPTDADLLSVLVDDAKAGNDPRTVLRMNTAPEDLDPFSEEAIRAANPAFDVFMNKTEVLAMAADAKRMPSRQAEYENLVLNRRVEVSNPFVAKSTWQANGGEPLPLEVFEGHNVYGGLDLSSTSDLTALVICAAIDGLLHVHCEFWLPETGLHEKSSADRRPYDLWHREDFLNTTPGRSIEYEFVAGKLIAMHERLKFRKIAFDRWNWRYFKPWVMKSGIPEHEADEIFVEFGQGYASMSPALRDLETLLLNEKVRHGMHPVLQICAADAVVHTDEAGNRKLDKKRSRGRIDGMVALTMAAAMAAEDMQETAPTSPWDDPDFKYEAA